MSFVKPNNFQLAANDFLLFGTMILYRHARKVILKCNYCQREMRQISDFMKHISKHINDLSDAEVEEFIGQLQSGNKSNETKVKVWAPEEPKIEKVLVKVEDETEECLDETTIDTFYVNEDDPEEEEDLGGDLLEIEEEIDESFEMESEDFPDLLEDEEEHTFEIEFCNEIPTVTEILESNTTIPTKTEPEDSNSNSNSDIAFLNESGSGFEVEFLETKKAAIEQFNASGKNGFMCMICEKVFASKSALSNHVRRHTRDKVYKCEICQAEFRDVSNLKVHRNRHLRVQPHSCDICKKSFTTTTELKIHYRSHTGEKPYICNICGASYSTSSHLTAHRYRHSQIRRHKCDQCDKAYFIKEDLRSHMRTHTNERPFECGQCGRTFSRAKSFKQHLHLHLEEKKFKCPCGKTFAQSAGLYLHKRSCKKLNKVD